ncbi:uncharacterized protein BXZ73DRAFT_104227 [Epithele typhae]|uniref:uncharacterized protein n=1 Tax=Epithele typhae TaxID=378194 RepID=UPI002008B8F9|nr:uncharacterized protein BXZ73DRAFT_104227 [Epithele typhae]KAH9921969.1 hypothetical protein BXZ73DRAFT_104227 [Epithele typhae]
MAASVSSAVGKLLQSCTAIGGNLLNSIIAIFQAFLALFQEVIGSVLHLVQALVAFAAEVFQGALGFVMANFFGLLVIGGVYYWYTHREGSGRSRSSKKRIP